MLTLTRRSKESVVVGDVDALEYALKVTVLRVRGDKVRLGFECPTHILIHRLEVWERARGPSREGEGPLGENPQRSLSCQRIRA